MIKEGSLVVQVPTAAQTHTLWLVKGHAPSCDLNDDDKIVEVVHQCDACSHSVQHFHPSKVLYWMVVFVRSM